MEPPILATGGAWAWPHAHGQGPPSLCQPGGWHRPRQGRWAGVGAISHFRLSCAAAAPAIAFPDGGEGGDLPCPPTLFGPGNAERLGWTPPPRRMPANRRGIGTGWGQGSSCGVGGAARPARRGGTPTSTPRSAATRPHGAVARCCARAGLAAGNATEIVAPRRLDAIARRPPSCWQSASISMWPMPDPALV